MPLGASSGTEGASFLDIPVGARPAALGSAYTAMADDAYAPVWNPGALGFLDSNQLAAQHLSYLTTANYEFASFVHPFRPGRSIGTSLQYVTSGNIAGTDNQGNSIGSFSSHYAAYNISYGQTLNDHLALGITGKWINAAIDDISANAYAVDFGSMYKPRENLTLAATLTNLGTQLKFLNEGDSLPLAFHLAGTYQPIHRWRISGEGLYEKTGVVSARMGVEWSPLDLISIRAGYRTDTSKDLSALAGVSTGIGIHVWASELAYAWVPYGELGNTQYISLVLHFGEAGQEKRNLIHYGTMKQHEVHWIGVDEGRDKQYKDAPIDMMQLLNQDETHTAQLPQKFYSSVATPDDGPSIPALSLPAKSASSHSSVMSAPAESPSPSEQLFNMMNDSVGSTHQSDRLR